MGVCHQHDASLLLLWLQCPASCAICVSWVVDLSWEFPLQLLAIVSVLAVSFVLASLTSVLYVSMSILILLCLLDGIFIVVCATCFGNSFFTPLLSLGRRLSLYPTGGLLQFLLLLLGASPVHLY